MASTVSLQREGPGLSLGTPYFLPQSKDMQGREIGSSKLFVGVNVSVFVSLYQLCDNLVTHPGYNPPSPSDS